MDTTYHVTLFGLEMDIDRVAFTLPFGENGWPIYWYGILISLGFLLALIYAFRNTKRFGIDNDRLIDCILVTTPLAILGARAYYLLFDGGGIQGFKKFFSIHDGGLAIYGGVITAVAVGALMCKIRRLKIVDVLDLTALGFLIGQAVGRWGNFFNQEAFGRYVQGSHLPDWWGMTSEAVADFYFDGVMVHPCFLYESIWCLLGFILLHILSRHRKFSGQIALGYGVWYGVGRFFIEGLRTDSLYIGSLRVSQLVSALAVVVCATLLIVLSVRRKKAAIPSDYTPLFTAEMEGTAAAAEARRAAEAQENGDLAETQETGESGEAPKTEMQDETAAPSDPPEGISAAEEAEETGAAGADGTDEEISADASDGQTPAEKA